MEDHVGTRRRIIFRPAKALSDKTIDSYSFLKFESTLAHVELTLPNSCIAAIQAPGESKDSHASNKPKAPNVEDNAETLVEVFAWLREKKDVNNILKLVVRDIQGRFSSDETIESCLHGFDVRYLDWNKDDLCIDTVFKEARNVVDLRLYSSGSNAVLWSWSDEHGLRQLKKVGILARFDSLDVPGQKSKLLTYSVTASKGALDNEAGTCSILLQLRLTYPS